MIDLLTAATAPTILDAALCYRRAGLTVLPVTLNKFPEGISGHENIQHPTKSQIQHWYQNPRYVGVALRPGVTSQNLIMIDCDGLPVYEAFCKTFPQLTETYTERSGSGQGMHLFFQVDRLPDSQHTPELKSGKVAKKGIFNTSDLGFEIFFDKGQVVVAPSQHKSGNRYTVEKALPVMRVSNIDAVIGWALALETEADKERKARFNTLQTGGTVRQGEIPDNVIGEIERTLGVTRFNADGWSKPIPDIFGHHEHDHESPAAAWNHKSHIFWCFKCGQVWLAKETAAQLGIGWPEKRQRKAEQGGTPPPEERPWPPKLPAVTLEKPVASVQVNTRYLSDAKLPDTARTLAIRSPLGSGKTQWFIDDINRNQPKRILYVTFQQSLTENAAERLNEGVQGEQFEHYLNIPPEFPLAAIDRLVVTLNSLYRCEGADSYNLVVIDEVEQVIPAIWNGTLHGKDINRTFNVLVDILKRAKQVVVMDAHLSQPSVDFLRDTRGECVVIENTYRPTWSPLTLYQYESKLIDSAVRCAEAHPDLPIVITTSSRKVARRYQRFFSERFGADTVKLVYGWNSHDRITRTFLKNINCELPNLRVLITSPTVGTGVDVTCDIAGVFGYFPGNHLSPTAMLQQLARYRKAQAFGAVIPNMESSRPEAPEELLSRTRFKIQRTRALAGTTHDVSVTQGQITRLWASYTALHNRLSNRPVATFVALAEHEGFPIAWVAGRAEQEQANLKAAQAAQQQEDDTLTLTLTPISAEDMDFRRLNGQLAENDYLAHWRWKVEDTTGQTITPDLLTRYGTKPKLKALVRFTTYHCGGMSEAARLDRSEVSTVLPFKRAAATLNNTFLDGLLKAAFFEQGLQSTEEVPATELERRITPYLDANRDIIRALDDQRTDYSPEYIPTFRRMLARYGIVLNYRQLRIDGQRVYVYSIDHKCLTVLMADAEQRWKFVQEKLSQNVESPPNIQDLRQPMQKGVPESPKKTPPEPIPAHIWTEGHNPNPFAGMKAGAA